MILDCLEVQYIRNDPDTRISTVGPGALAAMDICIALQEQEYSKSCPKTTLTPHPLSSDNM